MADNDRNTTIEKWPVLANKDPVREFFEPEDIDGAIARAYELSTQDTGMYRVFIVVTDRHVELARFLSRWLLDPPGRSGEPGEAQPGGGWVSGPMIGAGGIASGVAHAISEPEWDDEYQVLRVRCSCGWEAEGDKGGVNYAVSLHSEGGQRDD